MKLSARVSKFFIALLSLILTFSGVISPVQATGFPPNNGFYVCTTGEQDYDDEPNTYLINQGVVVENNCPGAVVIAEGVTGIDQEAFSYSSITSIYFPVSVTSIGGWAFNGSSVLTTVSFAQGSQLSNIGEEAFYGTALTSINIPAGVTSIGDGVFGAVNSLTSINVDSGNSSFKSIDGALFNAEATTLLQYPLGRSEDSFLIPASVTSIEGWAFNGARFLTTVSFAEGSQLTTIGDEAFANAASLTSLTIPGSVTSIGYGVISYSEALHDVYFWGNAPAIVDDYAFDMSAVGAKAHIKENATGFGVTGGTWKGLDVEADLVGDGSYVCTTGDRLTGDDTSPAYQITNGIVSAGAGCAGEVVIRDGAVWIAYAAFYESGLASVAIPQSVTSIGGSAFYLSGLASVDIPQSVTSIGIWAFCETSVTSINVDPANNYFDSEYGVLFSEDLSTLIAYPSGSYLANYSVPTSVLTISDSAFYKSLYLESVHIPNSVTDIQAYAFADSPELETVTFGADSPITKVKNDTFSGLPKLSSITIPEGVTNIEDLAFSNATSLTDVNFLGDAPTVAAGAFTGIFSGATAYVKSTATGFVVTDGTWNGLLVEANLVVDGYYACASGLPSESSDVRLVYTVTNKVVLSGTGCTGSVVIPAGIKEIGGYAFNSSGITSISLPAGLKKIGSFAFASATSLSSVTIPASLTTIAPGAFAGSAALIDVNFLGNAPTVGLNAFSRVASGAKAKISSSATGFGNTGDLWSGLLVEANPVVVDGDYVCSTGELRSQNDTSAAYTVINFVVTDGKDCEGAVVITEGVTSIRESAFDKYYGAQTITSITIPATVTSLQSLAFSDQELLSEVNFVGNAPGSVVGDAFYNVAAGAKAYITASATGFGSETTWNGLVIDRAASVSAPVTNSPTTSSPVTNSPTSSTPVTNTPTTSTPVTNTPTTSTPDTTTPVTTVPITFAVTSYEVRFAAGSSVLTQAHKTAIKKIVSKSGKMATFTVIGVAAKVVGVPDSLARLMAKARAEKIRAYFMNLGVKKSAISIKVKIVDSGVAPKTNVLAKQVKQ
jgi:hypothetical protein